MSGKKHRELERSIHECLRRGDRRQAAELGIRGYGPELLNLLGMELGDPTAVQDVFSAVCENIWKGIHRFRGECLFRTWAYCVARHTAYSYLRSRAAKREELRSSLGSVDWVEGIRSSTQPWLKSDIKAAFAHLRQRLSQEDQELLFLRINRQMSWDEVAYILAGEDAPLSQDELRKRSSVLRKRFQHLKEMLRQMAAEDGLLPQPHA
jgi:RNA polymerase sigma-70 factor, ECF subfamily